MQMSHTQGGAPVWLDRRAIALLLVATLTTMANATISPALPGLKDLFYDHPHGEVLTRLLVPAPSLTVMICAPFAGILADRFGRRWMMLAGVLLFTLMGAAGLVLPDLTSIFISRLGLGVAVAMIMAAQTALIGDYFAGQDRTTVTGLQISARNFAAFVFLLIAGGLAAVSPRLPFAIYAVVALMLPFMWRNVPEPRRDQSEAKPDSGAAPDLTPDWLVLFAGLVVLQLFTTMIFFVMPTQLPFFFAARGGDAAVQTGAALSLLSLAGGIAALLYGQLSKALGYAGVYALGYAVMGAGFAILTMPQNWAAFAGAAAIGAGFATVMPNFVAIALNLAPAIKRGLVGGILTTAVFSGQFLSPLASLPAINIFGYSSVFGGTALGLGIAASGALIMQLRIRRS